MTEDRKAYIYALRDPDNQVVHYVGRTLVPRERLYSHLLTSGMDSHPRHEWLGNLASQEKRPEMVILETTTNTEMELVEKKWIAYGIKQGWPLTNISIDKSHTEMPTISRDYGIPAPTEENYQTIKIKRETHRKLRILAATTGESMLDLIDRLIEEEQETQTMNNAQPELIYSIPTNEDYYTNDSEHEHLIPGLLDNQEKHIADFIEMKFPGMAYEIQRVPETQSFNNQSRAHTERAEQALEAVEYFVERNWVDWFPEMAE